jgi:DNA-binding beta-propeller fold protein YncE
MKASLVAGMLFLSTLFPVAAHTQTPTYLGFWWAPRAVGITFDPAGNVYVAEYSNYPTHIDVHAPDGTLLASWGSDGPDVSSVTGPYYIAADANGHLFIAEWTVHNPTQSPVQEFTTGGVFVRDIGFLTMDTLHPSPGAISSVGGVAVDSQGRVYVTDVGIPRTQVFSNDGTYLYEWPSYGECIALDALGHAFEVEDGDVVRKYDVASGADLAHWGSNGSGPGQFNMAQGIAVDASGKVYVTDTYNNRVQVFDNNGVFLLQWGEYGYGPGQFYRPMGMGIAADGRIYVGDTWGGRVQIFGSLATPARSTSWGSLKAAYR